MKIYFLSIFAFKHVHKHQRCITRLWSSNILKFLYHSMKIAEKCKKLTIKEVQACPVWPYDAVLTTHPDFVITYMRYIAFLLKPLYCTRSLLSAIIRDKRLITNNLCFFPLVMDNYDKKPNCWHCIKPSRVIFARFFPPSIYANGSTKSYGSANKCETWNWLLKYSAFNMFFLSFCSFLW